MVRRGLAGLGAALSIIGAVGWCGAAAEDIGGLGATKVASAKERGLGLGEAVLLGIVEGATEYLPVSSTGHLCVVQRLLGIGDTESERRAANAYAICIQAGAIAAVIWLYRTRMRQIVAGVFGRDAAGLRLLAHLVLAFVPAACLGLAFGPVIKDYLFDPLPIAIAWLVGGVGILLVVRSPLHGSAESGSDLPELTWKQALAIGLVQVGALWPGVSRSLVTILGGLLFGLRLPAAVEFSFLLGLVTLTAATAWDFMQDGRVMLDAYGWEGLAVGFVAAFVSALVAVRWMVAFLGWRELAVFGYYRMAIAAVTVGLIAAGVV